MEREREKVGDRKKGVVCKRGAKGIFGMKKRNGY